ncbi:MAG: sigma-54 dependent transcriptional regulator [Gallionellaceae bacterium]|nr:sigma-54 dependent transcriptional regulator [Gallionellaceae bacterium]
MNLRMATGKTASAEMKPTIVVAEDDRAMRNLIATVLGSSSRTFEVVAVENAHEAMDYVENHATAVVVTDLRMPGASGLDLLDFVKAKSAMTQVVLVTGYATVESAVRALKNGAYDYILKPFNTDELLRIVELALERYLLVAENDRLKSLGDYQVENDDLVGQSRSIELVRRHIGAAAAHECSVFISGESGSGKEIVARLIHARSKRSGKRFIAINCAAIPDNLIESELFGYKRGAFTGADRDKVGLFEAANDGTLFLDEINSASPSFQAKLMRVLQDGSFMPMGATHSVTVDVQVLAATNKPIMELVEQQAFREDLYYRLMVMEIHMPPLRERSEDIGPLAYYFLNKHAQKLNRKITGISTEALSVLMRYDWPGNVRELENIVQRMIILSEGETIEADNLPDRLMAPRDAKLASIDYLPPQSLEEIEAYFIRKTLRDTRGDRALAAEILGIDKSTLWRKIKRYEIE